MNEVFEYTAKDLKGRTLKSFVEAGTRHEALDVLHGKGMTVMKMDRATGHAMPSMPVNTAPVRTKKEAKREAPTGKIPVAHLSEFCRQLTISVSAGVPLAESLEMIAMDVEHTGLKRVLGVILEDLQAGASFSDALERHSAAFGTLFSPLVRSAEAAGSLPETLSQLADYMESREALRRKIRGVTTYPIFMSGFFVIVCIVMTVVVLPRFKEVFGGMEAQLPPLTRFVFAINGYLLSNALWMVPTILTVIVASVIYLRTESGIYRFDSLKLNMPIIGPCVRKLTVARFCRNLSIMVKGGVPITTALEISSSICGNKVVERSLLDVLERIMTGSDIASSLGAESVFPHHMVRMVAVGEQSGELSQVLEQISVAYERQAESSVTMAASLAEPIFICVFGALILCMVMAIYLPVFTISGHA